MKPEVNETKVPQPAKRCEHCGKVDDTVARDRFGNVLCRPCAEREAEAEWED